MKVICTKQERENVINAFNAWCPFDITCPYKKYGYKCNNCVLERVEFEITDEEDGQSE